jgi:hypothetical protein
VRRTPLIDIERPRTHNRRLSNGVLGVYEFAAILLADKLKSRPHANEQRNSIKHPMPSLFRWIGGCVRRDQRVSSHAYPP